MMKITQMPVTVTLKSMEEEERPLSAQPWDLSDLPTDTPIQVFGWMEYRGHPCWLLLGYKGVHPVHMSLVGNPMSWDEEVTG